MGTTGFDILAIPLPDDRGRTFEWSYDRSKPAVTIREVAHTLVLELAPMYFAAPDGDRM